jgi:phosphatidylglycerol:prolipoprotein diacylglycerol transferase
VYPELFQIGNIEISSYGAFHILAFIICYVAILWDTERRNYSINFIQKLFGITVMGGLIGSKILPILSNFSQFLHNPIRTIIKTPMGRFHTVLLGGTGAFMAYLLIKKRPIKYHSDITVTFVLLAQVIGRIGCFLNGCCHGSVTDSFLGVRYPAGSIASNYQYSKGMLDSAARQSLPVHPVQLYEISINLILFFVFLHWIIPKMKYQGTALGLYLIALGITRFFLEFLRINPERYIGLTDFQLISVFLFLLGNILIIIFIRQGDLSSLRKT